MKGTTSQTAGRFPGGGAFQGSSRLPAISSATMKQEYRGCVSTTCPGLRRPISGTLIGYDHHPARHRHRRDIDTGAHRSSVPSGSTDRLERRPRDVRRLARPGDCHDRAACGVGGRPRVVRRSHLDGCDPDRARGWHDDRIRSGTLGRDAARGPCLRRTARDRCPPTSIAGGHASILIRNRWRADHDVLPFARLIRSFGLALRFY